MSHDCVLRGSMRKLTLNCCGDQPLLRWICRCLKTEEGTPKDCVPTQAEYDRQRRLMPEPALQRFDKTVQVCDTCAFRAVPVVLDAAGQ